MALLHMFVQYNVHVLSALSVQPPINPENAIVQDRYLHDIHVLCSL